MTKSISSSSPILPICIYTHLKMRIKQTNSWRTKNKWAEIDLSCNLGLIELPFSPPISNDQKAKWTIGLDRMLKPWHIAGARDDEEEESHDSMGDGGHDSRRREGRATNQPKKKDEKVKDWCLVNFPWQRNLLCLLRWGETFSKVVKSDDIQSKFCKFLTCDLPSKGVKRRIY